MVQLKTPIGFDSNYCGEIILIILQESMVRDYLLWVDLRKFWIGERLMRRVRKGGGRKLGRSRLNVGFREEREYRSLTPTWCVNLHQLKEMDTHMSFTCTGGDQEHGIYVESRSSECRFFPYQYVLVR